jgi:hypothetical protein
MRIVSLDSYVIDTLLPDLVGHDRSPSSFLVWLVLWREAQQNEGRTATLSLRAVAERSGLSKRAVQDAVRRLKRRRLIAVEQESATAIPVYTPLKPWSRR